MTAHKAAPGPSGVPAQAWDVAVHTIGGRMRNLFTECLKRGEFPSIWKKAHMVLIKKTGRSDDRPAAYRPICLLDDEAKMFERIIANRIVEHLEKRGPDLHAEQYGFRRGRSTIDAIL